MSRATLIIIIGVSKVLDKLLVATGLSWLFDKYIFDEIVNKYDINMARVPLVVTACMSFFVILADSTYPLSPRCSPNISPSRTKKRRTLTDIVNDIDIFSTLAFVWAQNFFVKQYTMMVIIGLTKILFSFCDSPCTLQFFTH